MFLVILFFLAGVSKRETQTALQMPETIAAPEVKAVVESSWPKLLRHCPGFNHYANDFTLLAVSLEGGHKVIWEIKIVDDPNLIPGRFRASSHHCRYAVNEVANTMTTIKDVCAAVCLDREYHSSANYVGNL